MTVKMNSPLPLAAAFSPAKLNLFLHITGKRPDGYHNLQTVFYALDFGDELAFFRHLDNAPRLTLLGADGLTDNVNDNLIIKAGQALANFATQNGKADALFNIKINLTKKIPTGAGLGGGSSNAATTLLTLNRLWQLDFDKATLIDIAKTLGADVPFFIMADRYNACIGEGIGEILTPINLPTMQFLLLFPKVHSNTANVFSHPNLYKNCPTQTHNDLFDKQADYLYQLNTPFCNVFEKIACENDKILTALDYLKQLPTNATPRLTGTGSTVFLPIDDVKMAQNWLANAPCAGVICGALNA